MTLVEYDISRHRNVNCTSPVLYGCQLLQLSCLLRKLNPLKKRNLEEGRYEHDEGQRCEDEWGVSISMDNRQRSSLLDELSA